MVDELLTLLKREHPEYQAKKTELKFFLDAYEGGKEFINGGYLFTHVKEMGEDYVDRKKRASYFNYCMPVVDIYNGHLFRKPIERSGEADDEVFQQFLQDVDRRGNDINSFMKEFVSVPCQIFGYTFVLVDKPQYGPDILTKADEEAYGALPYFCVISPSAATNWSMDRYGQFYWFRYIDDQEDTEDAFSKPVKRRRYWTWTREEWIIHEETKEERGEVTVREVSRGTHGLGKVPIVPIYNRRSQRYRLVGISAIQDIAYLNRSIANVCSLVDEFLYRQCFNMLAMPEEGRDVDEEMQIGSSNVLYYPGGQTPPQYVTPPIDPARYMQEWIDVLKQEIYRLAKVEHTDAQPREQSGVAKAWDFHETNQALADKANNLQVGEQSLWRLWYKWQDAESQVAVDYPEDFDVRAVNAELEDALQLKALNISRSFMAAYFKKLVRRLDNKLPADVLEQIDREIDTVNAILTPDEEQLARQAAERLVEANP